MNPAKIFAEIIGWYGTAAIITAFALVSFSVLPPTDLLYHFLNGSGSIAIVYISLRKKAYQPGVLNIIWTLITLIALARIYW